MSTDELICLLERPTGIGRNKQPEMICCGIIKRRRERRRRRPYRRVVQWCEERVRLAWCIYRPSTRAKTQDEGAKAISFPACRRHTQESEVICACSWPPPTPPLYQPLMRTTLSLLNGILVKVNPATHHRPLHVNATQTIFQLETDTKKVWTFPDDGRKKLSFHLLSLKELYVFLLLSNGVWHHYYHHHHRSRHSWDLHPTAGIS